jgi:hypothetical protein
VLLLESFASLAETMPEHAARACMLIVIVNAQQMNL